MKKIPEPPTDIGAVLTPGEMNKVHFGGLHTPLTPDQIKALAEGGKTTPPQPPRRNTRI